MEDFNNWRGKTVFDKDGNKIGTIGQLYVDDENERPAWATVKTGFFGTKENFIPISLTRIQDEDIYLETTEEQVKNAPKIDVDENLSTDEERELYEYYQQDWDTPKNQSPARNQPQDSTEEQDDNQIHEHDGDREANAAQAGADAVAEAHGTAKQPEGVVGQYRLRKYKVREEKTITVPVEREEVRLEPIEGSSSPKVANEQQSVE